MKTRSVHITHHYRNGVHSLVLRAYAPNGLLMEKARCRITADPNDHEPILRMYERQTGRNVLRTTRWQTTTTPPYGSWGYLLEII